MDEYTKELIKEVLAEAKKARESVERLEKLAQTILSCTEVKNATTQDHSSTPATPVSSD
jgi:hypothetical protein